MMLFQRNISKNIVLKRTVPYIILLVVLVVVSFSFIRSYIELVNYSELTDRTDFLRVNRRGALDRSITNLQVWMIIFASLSIVLLIYTIISLFKQKAKTGVKENELHKSEMRFRALVENNNDIIVMLDKNMDLCYHSPSAERFRGYTAGDGVKVVEIDDVHQEDREQLEHALTEVTSAPGKVVDTVFRVKHKLGHYLWLEGTLTNLFHDPDVGAIVANMRDMTERKKNEDDLRGSLKEISDYKYALDESSIVAITDQKGVIKYVNDKFCEISKYERNELLGEDHRIINSGHHPKQFISDLWKTIASGRIWKGQFKNKAKDGSYYWVDTTIIPFLNNGGKPYQYVSIRSDITLRKEAEALLLQKAKQIEDILERIADGFIALDSQFRYTYANNQIGKMTGRDPKSLIGKYVWDEFPDAIGSATYKAFERAFKEQQYLCELDSYPPLNLWQENHIYPSEGGLAVFIRDITFQKRHEQEIHSAYQRLAFHFTNTPLGVMEWETDGNVIQWSEQAENMLGWKAGEVIGRNIADLDLNLPEQAPDGDKLTRMLLDGELERLIGTTRNKTKSGKIIHTEWYSSVLKNDDGEIISIVSLINDITARKEAEQLITNLNEELESKVIARTEQLERVNSDLEAFSYSVSHDLRAPLRAINGYSTMLQDLYGAQLDGRADRLINTIVSGTVNMGRLIDDLLKFSRLGRKELTIEPVNMYSLLQDCIHEIKLSYPELNPSVDIQALPACLGDRLTLRQVWMNLVGNAMKYSSKIELPVISISFKETKRTVTYVINDNGVGFDMQYADKLFGVFQRLHRQSEFEGTGIGLALVKRIIEKHEGKVWADAEVGKGATFYFTLTKYNKP